MTDQPWNAFMRLQGFARATHGAILNPGASSPDELKAVEAVVAGDYDTGIATLEQLEAQHPGSYSVAANLGTTYELKGDNQRALQWITEDIRRNPASHDGTEWLHQRILEVKLLLAQDPAWLQRHRVLELDEQQIDVPTYRYQLDGHAYSVEDIRLALHHQLMERMLFVKPADAVVADLLFTYGLVEAHRDVVESALELDELAKEYGFASAEVIAAQEESYQRALFRRTMHAWMLGVGAVGVFVVGLYFCYRRKWFFLSRAAYWDHVIRTR